MPMKSDDVLHFEAAVLDDEPMPWSALKVADVISALADVGLHPENEPDPAQWAAAAERTPHHFLGRSGQYALALGESGTWWWDTPAATLMESRFRNRPEAVEELIESVRAIIEVAPPYYGCTWYRSRRHSPWWMLTHHPFRALEGRAMQFFSRRYLEIHNGGAPYPDPPGRSYSLADGQFLVAPSSAFGVGDRSLLPLTEYFQARL
ncbi:hypothetical protein ACFYYY_27940 [Streptomyces sp. NPDC001834]|uniref:hypothetical protein n=1 Tax=Streptomyces sp. NPDC001834 TaxID=3364616 RepID=UPI0036BD0F2F